MRKRQTLKRRHRKRSCLKPRALPHLWLISDARNDAMLTHALRRLPRGSGFVFRHYHLPPDERYARWRSLARVARKHGHTVILAGSAREAAIVGADGTYGTDPGPCRIGGLLRIATAHDLAELGAARLARADAVMLSPAFPTRSHPGVPALGPLRFRLLARQARMPVIALGGMNRLTAKRLAWPRWAAIDGLS